VADGLRERNYLAFFELDDTRYLSFRSTDLMGDQQQDMHIYEVGTAPDGEFVVPTEDAGYPQVVPVAGFPGSDLTLFGPAPFRTLFEPGEDPCEAGDDDDDSAGDDDDATDDDDDDTGIPPGPGCRCRSSLAPPVAGSSLAAALLALVAFRRVRR
jgi:hypothetical protein